MTIKEIAIAVGKPETTVRGWTRQASMKSVNVKTKLIDAKETKKPADFDLDETCLILDEGLGKNAADIFRENAIRHSVPATPKKEHRYPSPDEMREYRMIYGEEEAGKRIDFMIGYSRRYDKPKLIEAPLDAKVQPELFNGIFAKLAEAKKV